MHKKREIRFVEFDPVDRPGEMRVQFRHRTELEYAGTFNIETLKSLVRNYKRFVESVVETLGDGAAVELPRLRAQVELLDVFAVALDGTEQ